MLIIYKIKMSMNRLDVCKCQHCNIDYTNKLIGEVKFNKNINLYTSLCKDCRMIKNCKNCDKKFKHKQNQTCSKECAEALKIKSYMKSCGTPHNFSKKSKSRIEWETRLFEEEGIVNVFQREDVKNKIRNTMNERYGGWYSSTEEGKTAIHNIFMEKYGRNWISLSIPEIYEAYKKTTLQKWGTEHWSQSEEGRKILSEIATNTRNSEWFRELQISRGNWKNREDLTNIENYYFKVYKITEENLIKYGDEKFGKNWENRRGNKTYHIDHVYPIIKSYYENIPCELVGSILNLELIKSTDNLKKGTKITKIPNHIKNWINENKKG